MILLLNLVGLSLIIFIIWWFWFSKSKAEIAKSGVIQIVVKDGVYSPARIEVKSGEPVVMEFIRQDSSGCSETIVFDGLNRQEQLPFNKPFKIDLGPLSPGTYPFACQMKMYSGELIVL